MVAMLRNRTADRLRDAFIGKAVLYSEGWRNDVECGNPSEERRFVVTEVRIDLSDGTVFVEGDIVTHTLSMEDLGELVDDGVFYEGRMGYAPLSTLQWRRYALADWLEDCGGNDGNNNINK